MIPKELKGLGRLASKDPHGRYAIDHVQVDESGIARTTDGVQACVVMWAGKGKKGSTRLVQAKKWPDGEDRSEGKAFPRVDDAIPEAKDAKHTISVDPRLLGNLLIEIDRMLLKPKGKDANTATIRFYADNRALRIDAAGSEVKIITAVLMPHNPKYLMGHTELEKP